jgi:REP element-mobilizing transposase RayT
MARSSRSSRISPDEVTIVHVTTQVAQQMFLLGKDSSSGQDFSHRKDWIINIMSFQSLYMGIDVLRFAVMDNHVHFLLRTRPDVVGKWTAKEVVTRWMSLCPQRKRRRKVEGKWVYEPIEPTQEEIDAIANDEAMVKKLRRKLSSVSFWMQLLKQKVAKRANAEVQKEGEVKGAFWKGRFHMTVIHSSDYLLSCAVYIDLNAIRAKVTNSLDGYQYTSIYMQLEEAYRQMGEEGEQIDWDVESLRKFAEKSMLSPVEMKEEKTDEAPADAVEATPRCSDTGFLQISLGKYCSLLVWSIQNDCANRDLPSETLQDQKRDKPKSRSSDPQVDQPKEAQVTTEVTRSTATEQQDDRSTDEVFDESLHPVVRMHGMGRRTWNDRLRLFRKLFPREAGVHPNQRDTESCKNAFPNQVKEAPMGYELHWGGRKTTQIDSIYQFGRLPSR